jgi:hypothetical protein
MLNFLVVDHVRNAILVILYLLLKLATKFDM